MRHTLQQLFRTHRRTLLLLALIVLWNESVYYGGRLSAAHRMHWDMTLPIDVRTPLLPWTVAIYFGCFAFWAVCYFRILSGPRTQALRFFLADVSAKAVCLVFFVALPTTNVRPAVVGTGVWETLLRLLYAIDAPNNLFPSIHCLVSWLCWVGLRGQKDCPAWGRWGALLGALAVCLSTLTTKQHVIADVLAAIVLAELCYALAGVWARKYTKP